MPYVIDYKYIMIPGLAEGRSEERRFTARELEGGGPGFHDSARTGIRLWLEDWVHGLANVSWDISSSSDFLNGRPNIHLVNFHSGMSNLADCKTLSRRKTQRLTDKKNYRLLASNADVSKRQLPAVP